MKRMKQMRPSIGRSILRIALALTVVLAAAGIAGYIYLRNSEWWGAVTLFLDDHRAENFRTMHELFPSRRALAGSEVWDFDRAGGAIVLPATYQFNGEERSLERFLVDSETTGLLIVRDGAIVHERYGVGYGETSLITSFSMAKSVISALVGIAIDEGYIRSVDDAITEYVHELRGSGYDGVSIHDVLTMSSGVAFSEDYESFFSDVMQLPIRVFGFRHPVTDILAELKREREPGSYNNYISSDSIALGLLVSRATGSALTDYLSRALWKPAGMEGDAWWNTDYHGNELGHAFLSARLRDYARFGRLYLNEGRRGDRQIVPAAWIHASVNPSEPHLQPGDNPDSFWTFGYGYQWWIPEEPEGDFSAIGIWGQYIYVHPRTRTVIVKTGTDYHFDALDHETIAVFRAIAAAPIAP